MGSTTSSLVLKTKDLERNSVTSSVTEEVKGNLTSESEEVLKLKKKITNVFLKAGFLCPDFFLCVQYRLKSRYLFQQPSKSSVISI